MLYNIVPVINTTALWVSKFVDRVNLMLSVFIKHTHTHTHTHTHEDTGKLGGV